jgi:hypothetical protein
MWYWLIKPVNDIGYRNLTDHLGRLAELSCDWVEIPIDGDGLLDGFKPRPAHHRCPAHRGSGRTFWRTRVTDEGMLVKSARPNPRCLMAFHSGKPVVLERGVLPACFAAQETCISSKLV